MWPFKRHIHDPVKIMSVQITTHVDQSDEDYKAKVDVYQCRTCGDIVKTPAMGGAFYEQWKINWE